MDDDHSNDTATVDTTNADRSVWLMKCPPVVSKAWQSSAAIAAESPTVAKVVVSLDLLRPDDPNALQFTMEMAGSEAVNVPKSYSLNMFKDFVPMAIFSESNEGECQAVHDLNFVGTRNVNCRFALLSSVGLFC